MATTNNRVDRPERYQGKNGIEAIEVIHHYVCDIANAIKYLWRAGLKSGMGMEDAEKEIEDLNKALWYIEDYRKQILHLPKTYFKSPLLMDKLVAKVTGHTIDEISKGYEPNVGTAINFLLGLGIICNGRVYVSDDWEMSLYAITSRIQQRILDIEHQLLNKELESTVQVMNGQAVDGEDYVSKPGCVRETEPEHYDPLNMIVAWGRVYSLADEVRKKPNGASYNPCDNCDLSEFCASQDGTEPMKNLCRLHQANTNEYYREVGVAKYSPRFGTVEVVDEYKEMQLELKRLEEEDGV
jgi:hypothetical protein